MVIRFDEAWAKLVLMPGHSMDKILPVLRPSANNRIESIGERLCEKPLPHSW